MTPELDTLLETVTAHAHALNAEIASLVAERATFNETDGWNFEFLLNTIRTVEIPAAREEIAKLRRVKFGDEERVVKWVANATQCAGCGHQAYEHSGIRDECEYTACKCREFEGSIRFVELPAAVEG